MNAPVSVHHLQDRWEQRPDEIEDEPDPRESFDDTSDEMRKWLNDDESFDAARDVICAAIFWDTCGAEQRTLDLRNAIDRMRRAYIARCERDAEFARERRMEDALAARAEMAVWGER